MKEMIKPWAALFGLALSLAFFTGCHHHRHSGHGDPAKMVEKMDKHLDHVLNKIDATDEQKREIHLIAGKIVEDARQIREQSAQERKTALDELLSDNPDREELHRWVDEKAAVWIEFGHRTLDRLVEIGAVLTPGQRVGLRERFASAHGADTH